MTREPECDQRLLDILRDVWFQFSLEKRVRWLHVSEPGRWAGGLSVPVWLAERRLR